MRELVSAVNRAFVEAQSPVQIEHAKITYTAILKGGPDSALISYKADLELKLEKFVIGTNSSEDFADLEWRGIVVQGPIVLTPAEVTTTPSDLQISEIDVNNPVGLLQSLHPTVEEKLVNTPAGEVLNDPIMNFEDFRNPMTNWHFLFDPVGSYLGDGTAASVFSLGESSLREGAYKETEKDAGATVDGAAVKVHSSTPPPNGQITTDGFASLQGNPSAEFAIIYGEAPEGVQTSNGNANVETVGLSSFLDGNSYVVLTKSSNVTALLYTIQPHNSITIDIARGQSGELELTLPKKLIDGIYSVKRGSGVEIPFQQVSLTPTSTTIKFAVPEDTDSIELLATTVVPEFPVPILAMSIAIALLSIFGIRMRLR
jgi:hypothetical protein